VLHEFHKTIKSFTWMHSSLRKFHLIGIFTNVGYVMASYLKAKSVVHVVKDIRSFLSSARSRSFSTVDSRVDGEKAVAAMKDELHDLGVEVEIGGTAQYVPVIERMGETIKENSRG
jgi:hypothetical protein